jgi:hypothetical protein
MYKVKFTPYRKKLGEIMLRQTLGGKGISSDGRYKFYINENVDDPDFWVVQGKGVRKSESCKVASENTLLLTTEPKSVLVYPRSYIKQFGAIFSCQEQMKHKNLIVGPPILPWFIGYKKTKDKGYEYWLTYDGLIKGDIPSKTKLISVITSNKAFTKGHLDRIKFVEKLKIHYGDKIDFFGRGYRSFDDKWDVLAPYKYHISLENSSQKYYWTEKISDCFLSETFPIYYGCTNLYEYFPKESFQPINIHDFESTVAIIDRIIEENSFEQKKDILKECKMKVLKEYNMFDYIAILCDKMNPALPKKLTTIKPCRSTDNWHNIYKYMITISFFRLKQKFKEIFYGKSILHHKKY